MSTLDILKITLYMLIEIAMMVLFQEIVSAMRGNSLKRLIICHSWYTEESSRYDHLNIYLVPIYFCSSSIIRI